MNLLVNIDVDDLEKGIEFYRRGLGLRLGRRLFNNMAAEMLGAPSPLYLLTKPSGGSASTGASLPRDYRRHWTPVHLDFVVEDLEVAVGQARAAGARLEGEIQARAWGRFATLSDPFGHGFCLLQFIGRGYDEVARGPSWT
jgi:catechol 2,3-dioxygenase-like lactoylglutathione lyase family enzyme